MEIRTYKPLVRIMTVITIVAVLAAAYFYWQTRTLSQHASTSDDEVSKLVQKVGELIVLPQNEQPTIATVTDLAPLKNQAFFAHAEINDKVLIYQAAGKAILYRPSTNKIIEVAPINLGNSQTSAQTQTQSQNQVQVTPVTPPKK